MKVFENISYFVIMCVMVCYCNVNNDTQKTDTFVPTHEWQTVKKGQPVPKGLHIRINFETGLTEAKLLDPNENDSKSLSVVHEEKDAKGTNTSKNTTEVPAHDKVPENNLEYLEEALKNIPGYDVEPSEGKRYRTLAELKSEFKEMEMDMKTDAEIMQDLFKRYENLKEYFPLGHKEKLEHESIESPVSGEILNIFTDLEYLVHQIDNGYEFIRLKGFEKIVYPHLNGTEVTLKAEALKLLGSCLQNNMKVQIYALETNAGEHLLRILALEKNEHVKARAVYALGCLVRRFPLAQKQIISKHGMDVFQKILLSENPLYVKLKIKIMILLEDLVLEHRSVLENHVSGDPQDEEKLRQYYQVNLISKLSNPESCLILSNLLQENFEYDNSNVDTIDKLFSVINTFSHICKHHHYKDKKLLILFHKMQTLYRKVIKGRENEEVEDSGEDTEYYSHILDMIDDYINKLSEAKLKDEL